MLVSGPARCYSSGRTLRRAGATGKFARRIQHRAKQVKLMRVERPYPSLQIRTDPAAESVARRATFVLFGADRFINRVHHLAPPPVAVRREPVLPSRSPGLTESSAEPSPSGFRNVLRFPSCQMRQPVSQIVNLHGPRLTVHVRF